VRYANTLDELFGFLRGQAADWESEQSGKDEK